VKLQMLKKVDAKYKKLCCSIALDWKFCGDLTTDFVRTRIEKFKKKNKWNPNFDDEELEKRFADLVHDISSGFEAYLGNFGKDYFFHILDNLTMEAIDEETKHRWKFEQKKKKGGEK